MYVHELILTPLSTCNIVRVIQRLMDMQSLHQCEGPSLAFASGPACEGPDLGEGDHHKDCLGIGVINQEISRKMGL